MEPDNLMEVATVVSKLKMYPYFDVANYILMCMMVREDNPMPAADPQQFSRKHPLACWLSSMLMCFASVILTNLVIGEALITPFTSQQDLIAATVVWYLINYSPFDIVYKFCKFLPIKVVIYSLKEIQRAHKVHHGVHFALKAFPDSHLIICIVGVLKGAGYQFMRLLERLVRGTWTPSCHELLQPTLATKISLMASIVFILDHEDYIDVPHPLLYFGVVVVFVVLRLGYLLMHIHDPFHPFEHVFCAVFLGGLVDVLKKAVTRSDKAKIDDATSPSKNNVKAKEE